MLPPLLLKVIHWALAASMLLQPVLAATATDPGGNTSEFSACVTVTSTAGPPPQSTDPIFDAVDLPHDPALGPLWDGANLFAEQIDAYHAEFTVDGVSFVGLEGEEPLSESAAFLLNALRQDGTQTDLPAPDPMTGNPEAVAGWLVQDNILLRRRQTDLYEITATQAEGIELAYLLAAPFSASTADLELVVGLDTTLEAYTASEGLFLLDADGNGLYISGATAIDANGDSTPVAVEPDAGGMRLVVAGDWLSTAVYPVLVDPYVVRWETKSDEFTPAIAYDANNNRALIAYVSGNKLYTRLVSAVDGQKIHDAQLGTASVLTPWVTSPSVIFDSQQNEYLVVCAQTWSVTYWRVNAGGYQVGDSMKVADSWYSLSLASSADIAASDGDAGLVVWSDNGIVRGQRISSDGTRLGSDFSLSPLEGEFIAYNPAVAYDAMLDAYVVVWKRANLFSGEIWAATVSTDGTVGTPFQVSDDTGKEFDPDIAYSALTGQTLVVWSSQEAVGQAIQARRLFVGALVNPVFMVSQTSEINQYPRVAGSNNSNWAVTWQRTNPGVTPPEDDVWLSEVPADAGSDLTTSNRSIRAATSVSETHPSVALRSDFVPMVALVESTSEGSAIVLVIDTAAPVGNYAWHYEYDDLGRMTFACSDWHSGVCRGNQWQYQYDGAGNLLLFDHWDAVARETVTAQYVINGANQIECIDDLSGDGECDDGEFLWTYDAYGNLRKDGVTQYDYDAAGRLIWAKSANGTNTYTYNGDGERTSQTSTISGTTTYLLDIATSGVLSQTTDGQTTYYLDGVAPIAEFDGTNTLYYQYDGAGTVRQLADASGSVERIQTFDPYGKCEPFF